MQVNIIETSKERSNNHWLEVTITEGKNREIRRIFEHLGYPVSRLIRTEYGEYKLGKLREGEVKEVVAGG